MNSVDKKNRCPKCGGEILSGHDKLGQVAVICLDCGATNWGGHEEKVRTNE